MRAARSAAVRRGALGLVVVATAAYVVVAPPVTAAVAPGDTRLVTRLTDGSQVDENAVETTISGDGRHVVFASRGRFDDLDNDFSVNVFARDLETGRTTQISRGHKTAPGDTPIHRLSPDGESNQATISANGRFVAFVTTASNIVTPDAPGDDLVVCDRDPDADGELDEPIEAAPDLRCSRVSVPMVAPSGARVDLPRMPELSADGTRILWTDQRITDGIREWVVRYRDLAGGGAPVDIDPTPADIPPDRAIRVLGAYDGIISADGTHAAMTVDYYDKIRIDLGTPPLLRMGAQSLPEPDYTAIVVVNLETDEVSRVDYDTDGSFLGTSREVGVRFPALSADGSVVAFEAEAYETDFYEGWQPVDDHPNVYVSRWREETARIASIDNAGGFGNGARPVLSDDGRYVAFVTDSLDMHDGVDRPASDFSCLHPGELFLTLPPPDDGRDVRTTCQVVVRDLVLDASVLASPSIEATCVEELPPGEVCAGRGTSGFSESASTLDFTGAQGVPSLSADGSRVAFDSRANDLVPDDDDSSNESPPWDGFVRTFLPTLTVDPVDFGPVDIGTTASRTAELLVDGFGPVTVESITVEGAAFTPGADTCVGVRLHDSCLTGVRFTPTTSGAHSGRLVIRLTDGREFIVDLRGLGSDVPPDTAEFSATPDPVDFGPRLLLAVEPTATLTITNSGGSPMTVTSVAPVAPGDFTVRSTDCAVIAPTESCTVVVQFRPTAPGPRTGVLRVDSDAPGGPHLVGMTGSGSAPALIVNPGVSRPGRVITVSGTGFPAAAEVTVGYQESIETATATTSNEGTFTLSLLVFPKASVGQRTVMATVDGIAPDVIPPGRLLVVYPTMSPPEFLTRG